MTFSEKLNGYMSELNCTAKELTEASGLSASVISRYREGSRVPKIDSMQFGQLVKGIVSLATEKNNREYTEEMVKKELALCIEEQIFPYDKFQVNFDRLLNMLSINVSDLSRFLNFDSSYISRIRNGQRRPADPQGFSENVSKYIINHSSSEDKAVLRRLMDIKNEDAMDDTIYIKSLVKWLAYGEGEIKEDVVVPFLNKLDEFDLNEFIRSIHFDELKVPTMPFQLPTSKNYYGVEEMCEATLDFFKATVLSKSMEDLIANDDTPMADKANGSDFMKKYIFAVALTLKKGLHINFIHNVNRPFDEMMMGLEGWIPMYMTGQISPYYLKEAHNKLFGHFLYSSGAAALSGECIMDYHENGKMYLTKNKTEMAYYRQRALDLLSKAHPLMDIYRIETRDAFEAFMEKDKMASGNRKSILSALPLYTLTEELLLKILSHNDVDETDKKNIIEYVKYQREVYENILSNRCVVDEVPDIKEVEFKEQPMILPLAGLFYEKDIVYTYEEYLEHLKQTHEFEKQNSNYTVKINSKYSFKNIQIRILEEKWVIISKNKAPAIHFVIHNPQLRRALENMVIPFWEEEEE